MDKKKTTIKERVLLYAKIQGYSYSKFFKKVGLSYSNFRGVQLDSALQSDAIDKIISHFPDIDLVWLITGKGEIIPKTSEGKLLEEAITEYQSNYKNLYLEVLEENRKLHNEIRELRKDDHEKKKVDKDLLPES